MPTAARYGQGNLLTALSVHGYGRAMSTEVQERVPRTITIGVPTDRRTLLLAAVLLGQAAWLGLIMMRGWYSGPDLGNLGAATGRPLDAEYLRASLGGHFGAPARLLYWVLNRVDALNWGLTVVLRLALQALATYLLWRLLEQLVGRRRYLPLIVALYAVSPLLVVATAVLSNGLGLSIAQTCFLGAWLAHVRYTREGRLSDAVTTAGLVLLALVFADQSALLVLVLPVLSVGFLHQGTVRQRVRAAARQWPGWVALAVAGAVFAVLYLSGGYAGEPSTFGLRAAWVVAREQWLEVLGPALLGGPWAWTTRPDEWVAYGSPPVVQQVLGQLALAALVAWSVLRTGRRALLAWSIPVVTSVGGALLVGYGRHEFLGTLVAPILRYSYFTAMVLALGIALAFYRTPEEEAADPGAAPAPLAPDGHRWLVRAAVVVGAASLYSGLGFADRFWDNPAEAYVANLVDAATAAGPLVELYDSTVPNDVVPGIVPNHFVSDVLALAGVPAVFGGSDPSPLLADGDGDLVEAEFLPVADVSGPTTEECGTFLGGAGSTTLSLAPVPRAAEWYLQLQLYQSRPNTLTIEVRDADGRELAVRGGGPTVRTAGTLVAVNRRLGFGVPSTVTVSSADTGTSACLVHAYVGAPFPTSVE